MSKVLLATLAMGVVTSAASAQQASPPPATFAVYFRCDYAKEARSDTLFRQVYVPALEKQVKAGHFTRYAWSSHQIGGQWRRLMSFSATNVEHLITGRTALLDDVEKSNPKGSAEFDAICGSHDDYIWEQTSAGTPDPVAAISDYGYSRYMSCDLAKENEADLIMDQVYTPMMNKHLAAGHITSWAYLSHYMGGPIRRVLRWTAKDMMSTLKAEEMISTDMGNHPMYTAFTAACGGHSDYLWKSETVSK
jgi:hypothetical protein